MIEINLLPPEMRASVRRAGPVRLPWRRIAAAVGGVVLLVSMGLPASNGLRAGRLARLKTEWVQLQPEAEKLAKAQEKLRKLKLQAQVLQSVKMPAARWAPRLNLLSDAMVPQVWLTRLAAEQGKSLRLEGSAFVGSSGDGSGQVTKFLQHLKEHPDFQKWFADIKLESVQHRDIQNEEVVDFVLLLTPSG